jgi:hypothetical protein
MSGLIVMGAFHLTLHAPADLSRGPYRSVRRAFRRPCFRRALTAAARVVLRRFPSPCHARLSVSRSP